MAENELQLSDRLRNFSNRFLQREPQSPSHTSPQFDFPTGEDTAQLATQIEQTALHLGLTDSISPAPGVETEEPLDAAEIIGEFLDTNPNAKFLGDEVVVEGGVLPRSLQFAIDGVDNTVVFRELFVDPPTGAMAETVIAVSPTSGVKGTRLERLGSRWLRAPEVPVFFKESPRPLPRVTAGAD